MHIGKVFVSGGFAICFAALGLLTGFEFLTIITLAVLAHEIGHILAIMKLGGRIKEIRLECVGALIRYDGAQMSYIAELVTAFAGPVMNLITALLAAFMGKRFGQFWFALSGFSLVLGAFNLLPIAVLDGGRMLYMTMAQCWDIDVAEKSCFAVSCAFSLVLMVLGAWVLKESGWNYTLLLSGVWLFWASAIVKRHVWV